MDIRHSIPCQVCESAFSITTETPLSYVCPSCKKALGDMPKGVTIEDAVASIRVQVEYGFGHRTPRAALARRN